MLGQRRGRREGVDRNGSREEEEEEVVHGWLMMNFEVLT